MRGPVRFTRLRFAGLAATALLAAGAFGVGAPPGSNNPAPGLMSSSWTHWLGVCAWLAGMLLLATVWWRLGTALPGPPAVSLRWLLMTGALWAAPLLIAPPLASRDVCAYACQGAVWLGGADPYAVGAAAGGCPWVDAVAPIWRNTTTPYGPLAVALAGAAGGPPTAKRPRGYRPTRSRWPSLR